MSKPDAYYKNNEVLNFEQTTHAEERALFVRAKAGDAGAKEKLITSHLLFVANLARSMVKGRLPDDETVSAANAALVAAFDRFDPAFPNRFSAFLRIHIRGAVARLWREKNVVDKGEFSDGPIVSVPVNDDVGQEDDAEEQDHKEFLLSLMEKAKEILDPREKEIVRLLFCETPANQSTVARQMGLSRERVRQLFDAALEKLRKEMRRRMNEAGINQ